jgi:hypothetical protein
MRMVVFLSYSSRDRDFVRRLAEELRRASIEVWMDERELRVGESLSSIADAIGRARFLVVVVSRSSANSFWVQEEIDLAEQAGVAVLPVLVEDIPPEWAPRLSGLAHADFRGPAEYRRAADRLICEIQGVPSRGRFLRAKEAAAKVRSEYAPPGDLFGISQQGVALLYSLANMRDWEFADVTDGTSRFWIVEFHEAASGRIQAFAVIDGVVHPLRDTYRYDVDPAPIAGSVVVMSTAVNHLTRISEEEAREHLAKHADQTTEITRAYVRFRPVPLTEPFVDSDVAVAAALAAGPEIPAWCRSDGDDEAGTGQTERKAADVDRRLLRPHAVRKRACRRRRRDHWRGPRP